MTFKIILTHKLIQKVFLELSREGGEASQGNFEDASTHAQQDSLASTCWSSAYCFTQRYQRSS